MCWNEQGKLGLAGECSKEPGNYILYIHFTCTDMYSTYNLRTCITAIPTYIAGTSG